MRNSPPSFHGSHANNPAPNTGLNQKFHQQQAPSHTPRPRPFIQRELLPATITPERWNAAENDTDPRSPPPYRGRRASVVYFRLSVLLPCARVVRRTGHPALNMYSHSAYHPDATNCTALHWSHSQRGVCCQRPSNQISTPRPKVTQVLARLSSSYHTALRCTAVPHSLPMRSLIELGVEVEERPRPEHAVPRQLELVHGVHVQHVEPSNHNPSTRKPQAATHTPIS